MSNQPRNSNSIAGRLIQGGVPLNNQILLFNSVTNQWEFSTATISQPFAKVVKKIDQTVNNSIVYVDDDELFFTPRANKEYSFELWIIFDSDTTPDLKTRFNSSGGLTGLLTTNNDGGENNTQIVTADFVHAGFDATIRGFLINGQFSVGASINPITLQWAQNTADATDTKILKGSRLVVWEELP